MIKRRKGKKNPPFKHIKIQFILNQTYPYYKQISPPRQQFIERKGWLYLLPSPAYSCFANVRGMASCLVTEISEMFCSSKGRKVGSVSKTNSLSRWVSHCRKDPELPSLYIHSLLQGPLYTMDPHPRGTSIAKIPTQEALSQVHILLCWGAKQLQHNLVLGRSQPRENLAVDMSVPADETKCAVTWCPNTVALVL